jgi:hypothetical protein
MNEHNIANITAAVKAENESKSLHLLPEHVYIHPMVIRSMGILTHITDTVRRTISAKIDVLDSINPIINLMMAMIVRTSRYMKDNARPAILLAQYPRPLLLVTGGDSIGVIGRFGNVLLVVVPLARKS